MPNITMKDVAAVAQVDRSTVSLALRHHPSIPERTCRRIQNIADELGYVCNPAVSAIMTHLRRRESTALGRVLAYFNAWKKPDHMRNDRSLAPLFSGAASRASDLGYRLEEIWIKEPRMTSARLHGILQARGIEGFVVGPTQTGHSHLSFDLSPYACSAIGFSLLRPDLNRASPNYSSSITLAVRQLRHRGYRRIAFFEQQASDDWLYHQWVAGYLVAQYAGLSETLPPYVWAQWDIEAVRNWIKLHRPDAILSPQPWVGESLRDHKIIAPTGRLGFALLNWRSDYPEFSGIDQQLEKIGAVSVELALEGIHLNSRGIPLVPKVVQTPGVWFDGQTTPKSQPAQQVSKRKL